ncbi:GntR family transcriptional regulator [Agrococcus sp. ProA11]|uniref:GntR family transcriptional regulator n=1 Tax=Agrococcus chionoecetis TaxID=3153752 RepID=UPI0032615267
MPGPVPKYVELAARLREQVARQAVGTPVPSERDLAIEEGVSRMTARKAIEMLVAEGRVTREVGRGSFVARPALSVPLTLTSFTESMLQWGMVPSAQVVEATTAPAGELAATFAVAPDEPLVRLTRVRLADGRPMALERASLLATAAPGLLEAADFSTASLYDVLEHRYGVRFDAGTQVIHAGLIDADDAALLDAEPGSPALEFVRTSTAAGTVLERTVSIYPADRFALSAAITPTRAPGSAPTAGR